MVQFYRGNSIIINNDFLTNPYPSTSKISYKKLTPKEKIALIAITLISLTLFASQATLLISSHAPQWVYISLIIPLSPLPATYSMILFHRNSKISSNPLPANTDATPPNEETLNSSSSEIKEGLPGPVEGIAAEPNKQNPLVPAQANNPIKVKPQVQAKSMNALFKVRKLGLTILSDLFLGKPISTRRFLNPPPKRPFPKPPQVFCQRSLPFKEKLLLALPAPPPIIPPALSQTALKIAVGFPLYPSLRANPNPKEEEWRKSFRFSEPEAEKEVSSLNDTPLTKEELQDSKNKQLISKVPGYLKVEPEFFFLDPKKVKPSPSFDFKVARKQLKSFFSGKIDSISHYYPKRLLYQALNCLFSSYYSKEAQQLKQKALLLLLPFFIEIFKQTPERETQLKTLLKKWALTSLPERFSEADKTYMLEILDSGFDLFEPLFKLISNDEWKGKTFFYHGLYQLFFVGMPALLSIYFLYPENKIKSLRDQNQLLLFKEFQKLLATSNAPIKGKIEHACQGYEARILKRDQEHESRDQFFRLLHSHLLPHLAPVLLHPSKKQMATYIDAILKESAPNNPLPLAPQAPLKDLPPFSQTFTAACEHFKEKFLSYENDTKDKTYAACLKAFNRIAGDIATRAQQILGKEVATPGEFSVKSYLLIYELWNLFAHLEKPEEFANALITYFAGYLREAKLAAEAKVFEECAASLIKTLFEELPNPYAKGAVNLLIQQGLLSALFLYSSLPLIPKARLFIKDHLLKSAFLFLSNHQPIINLLVKDEKTRSLFSDHETLLKTSSETMLKLMGIFDKLFPEPDLSEDKKNSFFKGLQSIADEVKVKAIKVGIDKFIKPKDKDSPSTQLVMQTIKPIVTFLALGRSGTENHQKIWNKCTESLRQFYENLYDFDLSTMVNQPEALRPHILNAFEQLLPNFKFSQNNQ